MNFGVITDVKQRFTQHVLKNNSANNNKQIEHNHSTTPHQ
jgi:hypothetical protein